MRIVPTKIAIALGGLLLSALTLWALPTTHQHQLRQYLDDFLTDLGKALNAYHQQLPEDRVYAHFDRTLYAPGETIWLTAYVRDGATLKPSQQSDIVHIELIGPRGNIEQQLHAIAQDGIARAHFDLPGAAPGGQYKVKVYTQWLKNERQPAYFVQDITVQRVVLPRLKMKMDFLKKAYGPGETVAATLTVQDNSNRPLANTPIQFNAQIDGQTFKSGTRTTDASGNVWVKFDLPDGLKSSDGLLNLLIPYQGQTESIARSIPITLRALDLQFFPEGGDLISGLSANVGFRATNAQSRPADVAGVIRDSRDSIVAHFDAYHDGMGAFTFTPQADETYTAHLTRPAGITQTYPLPEALVAGYGIAVRKVDASQIYLNLKATHADSLYLVGTVRGHQYFATQVQVKPGDNLTTVPTRFFPVGVAQFTVFDSKGIERAERLTFVNADKQLQINLQTDKEKYLPRERVALTISVQDERGMPMPAHLSVGVSDDQLLSFADDRSSNILTWLLMEADLHGSIHEPKFYFDPTEPKAAQARDYLLMTAGWRRFTWEEVRSKRPPRITHTAEKALFAGRVVDAQGQPLPGVKVTIADAHSAITDADGQYLLANYLFVDPQARITFEKAGYSTQVQTFNTYQPNTFVRLYPEVRHRPTAPRFNNGGIPEPMPDDVVILEEAIEEDAEVVLDDAVMVNPKRIQRMPQRNLNNIAANRADVRAKKENKPAMEVVQRDEVVKQKVDVSALQKRIPIADDLDIIRPTPPQQAYYHRVREYAAPKYQPLTPTTQRTDFRSTIYWNGDVRIGRSGRTTLYFHNSDAITSFRVTAEGIASDGSVGRSEALFYTQMPFSLSAKMPLAVVTEDVVKIPLTLVNNTTQPIDGALDIQYPAGLKPIGTLPSRIRLQGQKATTQYLAFTVTSPDDSAQLSITFKGAGFSDAITQPLHITPKGFPVTLSTSGRALNNSFEVDIRKPVAQSVEGVVTVYPSTVSNIMTGIESMLRKPHGCFEQTSSSTYPNILALQYLQATDQAAPDIVARAKSLIAEGYSRLTSFESTSGGFEWFGGDPAHEGLTAYGLMEFIDMKTVYSEVDDAMIARTTKWLLSRRDGTGRFARNPYALHEFGLTNNDIMSIYITWALTEAGIDGLDKELAFAYEHAKATQAPYTLGLAANALLQAGQRRQGNELLQLLLDQQDRSGYWNNASGLCSAPGSQGNALSIETASLSALAMLKASGSSYQGALDRAMEYIQSKRGGYGGFGSTNSTVLALRAIVTYTLANKQTDSPGTVEVWVGDQLAQSVNYQAGHRDPIELRGFSKYLTEGQHEIQVRFKNTKTPLPFSARVVYYNALPASDEACAVHLNTTLSADKVRVGETVRLSVKLSNVTNEGQAMTVGIIGLPAGLSAQPWQLKELVERKVVDFYEIIDNNVVLYYREMAPNAERIVHLDLKAEMPGTFAAPASSAYVYYTDEYQQWAALPAITVLP